MSDDFSYTSSSQSELKDGGGGGDYDASSGSSELSELSAAKLATHRKYAIIWELFQGCQEAAMEDIPERHRDCLSVFNPKVDVQELVACQDQTDNAAQDYDELFRVAGAIKSFEPWSLPAVSRSISKEDALWSPNTQVLNVSEVIPTAAVYSKSNATLASEFQRISDDAASSKATEDDKNTLQSASPLVHANMPAFASTVFISASQVAHHEEKPSFHTLRRYNRLATTSLLRQINSFHIDSPVFGVLLRGSLVAFHIDWYEEHDGTMDFNSAWYAFDGTAGLKTWDLRKPNEAAEIKRVLSNLREYTAGPYTAQVHQGLKAFKGPVKPWKWHPSLLPEVLAYGRMQRHTEEAPEEKMDRWQRGIAMSVGNAHAVGLRQKLAGKKGPRVEYSGQRRRSHDFLSPPSTPQSPEILNTMD